MKLSVIIPVYNEINTIKLILERVIAVEIEVLAKCSAIRIEQAVLRSPPSDFYGRHGFSY
jgi:hypothetical protein